MTRLESPAAAPDSALERCAPAPGVEGGALAAGIGADVAACECGAGRAGPRPHAPVRPGQSCARRGLDSSALRESRAGCHRGVASVARVSRAVLLGGKPRSRVIH